MRCVYPYYAASLSCSPQMTCGMHFKSCIKHALYCFVFIVFTCFKSRFKHKRLNNDMAHHKGRCYNIFFVWMLKIYCVPFFNVNSAHFMHKIFQKLNCLSCCIIIPIICMCRDTNGHFCFRKETSRGGYGGEGGGGDRGERSRKGNIFHYMDPHL